MTQQNLDRFKFRVWDIKWTENPERMSYSDYPKNFDINAIMGDSRFILMQSTGLRDKNNKLIYEGDILSREVDNKPNDRMFCVRYNATYPSFYLTCGRNGYPRLLKQGRSCREMEIIGNIYENPELLEEPN